MRLESSQLEVNTKLQAGICTWIKPHKKTNK